jgi:single-strand DNA-binding protein
LARAPELKYTQSGKAVTTVRVAIDEGKDKDPTWVDVVAWDKTAEMLAQYMGQGDEIGVTGRLQSRQWETQDGGKRSVVEVVATRVDFLRKKGDSAGNGGGGQQQQAARPEPSPWPEETTDDPFGDQ